MKTTFLDSTAEQQQIFIKRTFQLAQSSVKQGNRPFGALLTLDNKIVLESGNTVKTDDDITAHAEMNLIRLAWQKFSVEQLQQAILYTSTEPCMMCAGAIINSPIKHLVYGCRAMLMHQQMDQHPCITGRAILLSSELPIQLKGPLLEKEALSIHLDNPWW